jgi:hypothetical protein
MAMWPQSTPASGVLQSVTSHVSSPREWLTVSTGTRPPAAGDEAMADRGAGCAANGRAARRRNRRNGRMPGLTCSLSLNECIISLLVNSVARRLPRRAAQWRPHGIAKGRRPAVMIPSPGRRPRWWRAYWSASARSACLRRPVLPAGTRWREPDDPCPVGPSTRCARLPGPTGSRR